MELTPTLNGNVLLTCSPSDYAILQSHHYLKEQRLGLQNSSTIYEATICTPPHLRAEMEIADLTEEKGANAGLLQLIRENGFVKKEGNTFLLYLPERVLQHSLRNLSRVLHLAHSAEKTAI